MADIYEILELTAKSHKQPVYLLNDIDGVKIKMVSPAIVDEIKYADGKTGVISIHSDLFSRTLHMKKEITIEQYEDNNFPHLSKILWEKMKNSFK